MQKSYILQLMGTESDNGMVRTAGDVRFISIQFQWVKRGDFHGKEAYI